MKTYISNSNSKTFAFKIRLVVLFAFLIVPRLIQAQEIDLLLKGGRVLDPKNSLDSKMDVAVKDGKIYRIAAEIPSSSAKKVLDVSGMLVSPGLINIHTHVYAGSKPGFADGQSSQLPDAFAPRSGITTVVDAGTTGWRTFPDFKSKVVDPSFTRVLAFINIFETGFSAGSAIEPDLNTLDVQMKFVIIWIRIYQDGELKKILMNKHYRMPKILFQEKIKDLICYLEIYITKKIEILKVLKMKKLKFPHP